MPRRHATPAGRNEPLLIALALLGDRPAATVLGAAAALAVTSLGYTLIAGFSLLGVLLTYALIAVTAVAGLVGWVWRHRCARAEPRP